MTREYLDKSVRLQQRCNYWRYWDQHKDIFPRRPRASSLADQRMKLNQRKVLRNFIFKYTDGNWYTGRFIGSAEKLKWMAHAIDPKLGHRDKDPESNSQEIPENSVVRACVFSPDGVDLPATCSTRCWNQWTFVRVTSDSVRVGRRTDASQSSL